MRIIKFRGKHVSTGEWCYGYYCEQNIPEYDNDISGHVNGYTKLPMLFNDEPGQNHGNWTKVKYNTVGQCTSLRDKNGRDIYEGDILRVRDEDVLLEVRFVRGVFAFLWDGDLDNEFNCNAPTHEWAEIIGNIHDNPGMIKKPAWSEEDDKMVKDIIAAIDTLHYHEMVDWLKSLKQRVQPQSTWKPSEEQIEAFEHFVRSIGESGYASLYENNTKLLYSLLEQLKVLE